MSSRLIAAKPTAIHFQLLGCLLLAQILHTGTADAEPSEPDPGVWVAHAVTSTGRIFHRTLRDSSVPMIMITTTFDTTPARVHAVVSDYAHFSEFIPHVLESRVLLREDHEQWVFHHLRFPGPLADRAYTFKSTETLISDANGYRVEWRLAQRRFPGVDQSVGIAPRSFSGFWELRPAADAVSTDARYAVHSEPGGMLPAWLVAKMTERYIQQVVEAIRNRLATR